MTEPEPVDQDGAGTKADLELALALQDGLVSYATGGAFDGGEEAYRALRSHFLARSEVRALTPTLIRRCRSLQQFWGFIKAESPHYQGRREFLWAEFNGLIDYLESRERRNPSHTVDLALEVFDLDHVRSVWDKALERRITDPEGAITAARALLESVLKHILDDLDVGVDERSDLPQLWRRVAVELNLAPEQRHEEAFRAILGSCQTIVNNIATIRNRLGDAHGSGPRQVRPKPRHAELVVNLAGAMAAFITETWLERSDDAAAQESSDA